MEYALVRVLGDAVDPGLLPILVAAGAALAIKLFYKKKRGK